MALRADSVASATLPANLFNLKRMATPTSDCSAVQMSALRRLTSPAGSGLERVRTGMRKYRLALMCAEKDPLTCHRAILVCRHLRPVVGDIVHILGDGSLETHGEAETRLLEVAAESGTAVIINRPFAEGAMFARVKAKPCGRAGARP